MAQGSNFTIFAAALAAYAAGAAMVAKPMPPKPGNADTVTVAAAVTQAVRSSQHRRVHRTAPKVAKRKWEPVHGVRPVAPIMREEKRARQPAKKRQASTLSGLPPCSVVRREAARMTWAQKLAAYSAATPEQIAHGRRCLGQ